MLQRITTRSTPKPTQRAARYTPAGGVERCGMCRHFAAPSACSRILGPVNARGWCAYFSQQVTYPHHAGVQSFLGIPPGASLDLSFLTPGALPAGVTFTRASTGTYFDINGTMQSAAVNAPRWDYDPVSHALRGLLIEEARTNTLLNSNTLNPTSGCVASTDVPVLFAAATQWKYTVVAAGGNGPIWAINAPSAASTTFAVSCWVYIPAAYSTAVDGMPRLDIDNSGLGTGGSQSAAAIADATKRNQWQRLVSTISFGTSPGSIFNVLIRNNAPTNGGSIFYCTCPQIEVGAFATSYIPTAAAAVTRAEDFCSVPVGAWYSAAASTLFAESMHPVPPASNFWQAIVSIDDGIITNRAQIYRVLNSNNVASQVTPTYNPTLGALTPGAVVKAAAAFQNNNQLSAMNGVTSGASAVATTMTGVNTLNIGHSGNGTPLDGYIRRVRYWPRVLSAAELQQVTT